MAHAGLRSGAVQNLRSKVLQGSSSAASAGSRASALQLRRTREENDDDVPERNTVCAFCFNVRSHVSLDRARETSVEATRTLRPTSHAISPNTCYTCEAGLAAGIRNEFIYHVQRCGVWVV